MTIKVRQEHLLPKFIIPHTNLSHFQVYKCQLMNNYRLKSQLSFMNIIINHLICLIAFHVDQTVVLESKINTGFHLIKQTTIFKLKVQYISRQSYISLLLSKGITSKKKIEVLFGPAPRTRRTKKRRQALTYRHMSAFNFDYDSYLACHFMSFIMVPFVTHDYNFNVYYVNIIFIFHCHLSKEKW